VFSEVQFVINCNSEDFHCGKAWDIKSGGGGFRTFGGEDYFGCFGGIDLKVACMCPGCLMVYFCLNGLRVERGDEQVAIVGIFEVVVSRVKGFERGRVEVKECGAEYRALYHSRGDW
jgi:hypothetical protein